MVAGGVPEPAGCSRVPASAAVAWSDVATLIASGLTSVGHPRYVDLGCAEGLGIRLSGLIGLSCLERLLEREGRFG